MLGLNSKNSSKLSSTDDPFKKSQEWKSTENDKKRLNKGGQNGHNVMDELQNLFR